LVHAVSPCAAARKMAARSSHRRNPRRDGDGEVRMVRAANLFMDDSDADRIGTFMRKLTPRAGRSRAANQRAKHMPAKSGGL
jgi:hypothetical protein